MTEQERLDQERLDEVSELRKLAARERDAADEARALVCQLGERLRSGKAADPRLRYETETAFKRMQGKVKSFDTHALKFQHTADIVEAWTDPSWTFQEVERRLGGAAMSQVQEDDRVNTAYHEAGHAVAAYVVGQTFEYVTIKPDREGQSLGRLHRLDDPAYWDATTQKRQRELARAEVVVNLASEEQWNGKPR